MGVWTQNTPEEHALNPCCSDADCSFGHEMLAAQMLMHHQHVWKI